MMMTWEGKQAPMVAHIIHRLAVGGLENGLVNLINRMPSERYRHAIICLTDSTDFRSRIQRKEVPIISLHKREGQDFGVYIRLWRILRRLCPDIVHTRNLSGLEYLIPAALAGVAGRVHGEHGRDVYDPDGVNLKYNLLRKIIRPVVKHYIAVSIDLARWLNDTVGVRADKVTQIYNGVDTQRFHPRTGQRFSLGPEGFAPRETFVVGTVGRMEAIKDPLILVQAFLHLLDLKPTGRKYLRLVMIGDGTLREEAKHLLKAADAEHLAWLPGERSDIPQIMQGLDLFVLPSLREGISNTILEAMASGLPIIATRVGGNPELVEDGKTGMLVPPADAVELAMAIHTYAANRDLLSQHGQAARKRVETRFSMESMVDGYLTVYDTVLNAVNHRGKVHVWNCGHPGV
jgi:sugar transferase (PEP-CTERM/EpsH1 system associated)